MIPKSGSRFSDKIMRNKKFEKHDCEPASKRAPDLQLQSLRS
jgi:hypothetical protein